MVLRENRRREDDTRSQPWFERIVGSGDEVLPEPLDRTEWEAVKDRYYVLCGWNVTSGRPTRGKLEALDMKGVADALQRAGRLG